ncbi:MAG: hypothetical protein U0R17_07130 [Acidimicrobiia bacterium]
MTQGRRFHIWPMVTIEVDGAPYEMNLINRPGLKWLRDKIENGTLTEQDIEAIQAAVNFDSLNPNSLNDYKLIPLLIRAGLLTDDQIDRIIGDAELSISLTTEKVKSSNIPANNTTLVESGHKSPGLQVLDDLSQIRSLTLGQRSRINDRKTDLIAQIVTGVQCEISRGM